MRLSKNRNGYWVCHVRGPGGKKARFSTKKRNKKDALELLKAAKVEELEMAAEIGVLTANAVSTIMTGKKKMTVLEAVEPWKEWMGYNQFSNMTIYNYENMVKAWAYRTCKEDQPIMGITYKDIHPWINDTTVNTKVSSRDIMLCALKSFFGFCSTSGWTMGNPARLVSIDYSLFSHAQKEVERKPIFEDSEIDDLLRITAPGGSREDGFWNAAIAIARWTGLRLVDICCLEWDCLSESEKLNVWTRKRDKRVSLDLTPQCLKDALNGVEKADDVYLFPVQRRDILDPNNHSNLSHDFVKLCRRLNILGKTFHCLRATLATRLDEAGVNREKIREILGHSSTRTTDGYIRPPRKGLGLLLPQQHQQESPPPNPAPTEATA
jgi:integrase